MKRKRGILAPAESGMTLVETAVALAVLGTIALVFLSGLAISSKAVIIADEQTTVESLAQSQLEWVKGVDYVYEASEYSPAPIPTGPDYTDYSANITAEPLHTPDDGIQKITVTVRRLGEMIMELEGYKVDR